MRGSTFLFAGDLRPWSSKEVDDVTKTLMCTSPAGRVFVVAREPSTTAPNPLVQGTGLSFAGYAAGASAVPAAAAHLAQVAVLGARVIDLPGPIPRGAPV